MSSDPAGRGAEGHELCARRGAGRGAQAVRRNTQPEASNEEGERVELMDNFSVGCMIF